MRLNLSSDREQAHTLGRSEVWALAGLLFFLPLLEAPKNLLWLAFVLLWLGRAMFAHAGLGGGWQHGRDLPFALLQAASVLACLLAPPFPRDWGEVANVLSYTTLGWLLARSRMTDKQIFMTLAALLAGTLAAAAQGWWQWQIVGEKKLFELHSVGHTNHSAIYLTMVGLGTLGALMALWPRLSAGWRFALTLAWAGQSWLIATGESRGAMLAYIFGTTILLFVLPPPRWRRQLLVFMAALLAIILAWDSYLIDKTLNQMRAPAVATTTSYRLELAQTALATTRQHPFAGIGPGNFRLATAEQVATWLAARHERYDPARYFHSNHAHNLYFNTLAERGLLGAAALLFLAWVWLRLLVSRSDTSSQNAHRTMLVWAVGMAGFVGVFVAGLFNTTLHHEHGSLAMFAFGLMMTQISTSRQVPPTLARRRMLGGCLGCS